MKVKDMIAFLREKDQEEELYTEWWTKAEFADMGLPFFDDATWARAIELATDADHSYVHGLTREMLVTAIEDAIEEGNL